jgi:hypothetical protein
MFWAVFKQDISMGLVLLDRDPESRKGGITGRVIVEVYRAYLPIILRHSDIFMHNGASVHTTYIVRAIPSCGSQNQ